MQVELAACRDRQARTPSASSHVWQTVCHSLWLVDGTPVYARSASSSLREAADNAMTTPEDARRIVVNYTDAEKIAVMHACGACGVRDPAKS
jgi:hypothetical protein